MNIGKEIIKGLKEVITEEKFRNVFEEEFEKIIKKYNYLNKFTPEQIQFIKNMFLDIAKSRIMKK